MSENPRWPSQKRDIALDRFGGAAGGTAFPTGVYTKYMSSSGSSEDIYGETLTVFEQTNYPNEPLTSPEVAEALDCPRRTAYKRLENLVDKGELRTKKVGSSARVWWQPSTNSTDDAPTASGTDNNEQKGLEDEFRATKTRYQRLVEQTLVGIYIVQNGEMKYANPKFSDILGYSLNEVIGESALDFVAEDDRALVAENFRKREQGEVDTLRYEARVKHADGTLVDVEVHGGLIEVEGEPAILGTMVDMSERAQRERELKRYETIFETIDDGAYVVDSEGCFTVVNETYAEMVGYDREELLGEHVSLVVDETVATTAREIEQEMKAGERVTPKVEAELRRGDGETITAEATFALLPDDSMHERVCIVRDISERKERERQLEQYERLVETVDDGVYAIDTDAQFVTVNEAFCEMVGWEREELLGQHATTVHADEITPRAEELAAEVAAGERDGATIELELHTKDGDQIPAESRLRPFPIAGGVGRCGVVRDITERKEREQQLERQRQQLVTLNDLHTAIRSVIDHVIEQSTRDEIEQSVCDQLTTLDIYDFAWVGRLTRDGKGITVHATSREAEVLTETTVSLDENAPTGYAPVARAVKTRSPQLARDIFKDPIYNEWTNDREYRDHSMLAVPISHEGRLYGVLTLYTDGSFAMGDAEQAIIQQFGEVIGHTITAIERKQSILADRMIEVEYHSQALAEPFMAAANGDLEISIDRAIPLGDGGGLQYHTLQGLTADQYLEIVEKFPSVMNVRILYDEGDHARVEVQTTNDTVTSLFTTFDGRTKTTQIMDGELQVVGELPATANIRKVTETVQDIYPDMGFAGQQHITPQQITPEEFRTRIEDSLTDRQRIALEAAFYAGFFAWNRESSGEDVANALDISSSTFHQHIRKAEKKLLDIVFAET